MDSFAREPAVWLASSFLLSLRLSPALALAPPFSMTRTPGFVRAMLGLGLAGCLAGSRPGATFADLSAGGLLVGAAAELALGMVFVLALHVMFAALQTAGRMIDVQVGFGLAGVLDPMSGAQSPIVGTLFAYLAGAVFFALGGHLDLLRIVAASLDATPLGQPHLPGSLAALTGYVSLIFLAAFGVVGSVILCLFIADLAIALMSRTVPQMNVLVFGFQVKSLLLLLVLPATLGVSGALLARMTTITLEALPVLLQ